MVLGIGTQNDGSRTPKHCAVHKADMLRWGGRAFN